MLQLKSLMEREALEGGQSGTASPGKAQQEDLFLFPAESSTLTTLPGVARVVHSKASCTVHWLESGKSRPNAKELPAAQILGIHTAPPARTGVKAGRGGAAGAAAAPLSADARRTDPPNPEPSAEGCTKVEDKGPQAVSVSVSTQQTITLREEGNGTISSEAGKTCSALDSGGGSAATKITDKLCSGPETSSETCKEEQNSNASSSPEANQTPPPKPTAAGVSEDGVSHNSTPAAKERTVEQIREEGWSARDSENVTLAELYLMFGKPGKLLLEYEWQPNPVTSSNQENGQATLQPKPSRTNRVLRCLLKLVATEVNPKPLVKTSHL